MSGFIYIPATQDGCTIPSAPIFRCDHFTLTGADAQYVYGVTCNQVFASDTARTMHQYVDHSYYVCKCGLSFATWESKDAHIVASFDAEGNLPFAHSIYHNSI